MFSFFNLALLALEGVAEAVQPKKIRTAEEVERDRIRCRNGRILWTFIILGSVGIAAWLISTCP